MASSCSAACTRIDPEMLVIIMTGYASVETAVAALKNGAYDYVPKPFDPTISLIVSTTPFPQACGTGERRLRETASVVRPQEMSDKAPRWSRF